MAKKTTFGKQTGNFMKYRYLLGELVMKNIKLQYRNSVLGVLWTFLQPLLTMIVLAFVFNNLFGRDSSTVMNAEKVIKKDMANNIETKNIIEDMESRIKE